MARKDFTYVYDYQADTWEWRFCGNLLYSVEHQHVIEAMEDMNLTPWDIETTKFFRYMCGLYFLDTVENEDNGFFVSAVLTKLFNYGIDWSKEVR